MAKEGAWLSGKGKSCDDLAFFGAKTELAKAAELAKRLTPANFQPRTKSSALTNWRN